MTDEEKLATKFSGISGGLHDSRGAVLTWGCGHDGVPTVLVEHEPTEYELTMVPTWVRREVEK